MVPILSLILIDGFALILQVGKGPMHSSCLLSTMSPSVPQAVVSDIVEGPGGLIFQQIFMVCAHISYIYHAIVWIDSMATNVEDHEKDRK